MAQGLTAQARWLRFQRLRREACPFYCKPLALPLILGTAGLGSGLILWQAKVDTQAMNQRFTAAFIADLLSNTRELQATAADWGNWDPSVAFLQGRDPSYFTNNVSAATLHQISVMALFNTRGQLVGGVTPRAPGTNTKNNRSGVTPLPRQEARSLQWIGSQISPTTPEVKSIRWRDELSILASAPVRGNDAARPSAGSVVFVRPIKSSVSQVGQALGVEVRCTHNQHTHAGSDDRGWLTVELPKPIDGNSVQLRFEATAVRWSAAWRNVAALLGLEVSLLGFVATTNLRNSRRRRRERVASGRSALRLRRALTARTTHDSLTNLPSLEGLIDALPVQQQRYPDFERVLVVADIDRFSLLNNALGRSSADRVLQQVAHQLRGLVHRSTLVARVGGDKFALALVGTSRGALQSEVQELTASLRELTVRINGEPLSLSACVGARWLGREDIPDQAISETGFACDMAKLTGRHEMVFFGDEGTTLSRYQTLQQNHQTLRQALHNDRITLFSQVGRRLDGPGAPDEGAVAYVELLARLQDPEGAHVYWSTAYLEAAEFWGTLAKFDLHMLQLACRDIRGVLDTPAGQQLPDEVVFALNITERSLLSGEFSLQVARALGETGIPPQRLCLEITEQVAMDNLAAARTVIERLKSIGVRVALDDFGAGMTSLNQLRELPLDFVKIDQAFTRDLVSSPTNQAVVRFIAELGQQLHFRTIAESIENPATALLLRELGVSIIQGFLIARPEPFSASPGHRAWRPERYFRTPG
jgi:diguanylate cyclase (GGDEF)-like protein